MVQVKVQVLFSPVELGLGDQRIEGGGGGSIYVSVALSLVFW